MVRPAPTHTAFVIAEAASFEMAAKLLHITRHGPTTPAAIELLAGQSVSNHQKLAGAEAILVVGFEDSEEDVEWMSERLAADLQRAGSEDVAIQRGVGLDATWASLSRSAIFQINVLPSALVDVTEAVAKLVPEAWLNAHACNGVLRGGWNENEPSSEMKKLVCERIRPIAANAGGNVAMLCESPTVEIGSGRSLMRTISDAMWCKG